MKRSRSALLIASGAVVLLLLGGGLGLRVGASEGTYRQVVLFSEILSHVLENYVDSVDSTALLEGAYEGMMRGLDSQGAYLTPEEVREWKAGDTQPHEADPGISVIKGAGALQVVGVEPGSPAGDAGVTPGDQIRSIDGRSLRDLSLDQAVRLLRGEVGSEVRLDILHPLQDFERDELVLKRALPVAPPYELELERGIALLRIRDLSRVEGAEVVAELGEIRDRGAGALLIDLRNLVERDPRSGLGFLARFVAGSLVLRDRGGEVLETHDIDGPRDAWDGPLAVLVNGATAGASEAVTRLLRGARGATVYGEATFGLGSEPRLFELPNGSGLLVSAATWETPFGGWHGDGVEPDREITSDGVDFEEAFRRQLERALEAFESDTRAEREAA